MSIPRKKAVLPPEGGWKPSTYYVCRVSYRKENPVHTKIFYSGFLDDKGNPSGYNQFFEGNDDGATHNSSIDQIYYCQAIFEIPMKIDNP